VISGNHRLGLYRQMGIEKAPVHVVDVDDAHARVLAQVLNRTRGQDDPDAYARLINDVLSDMSMDELLGFLPESEKTLSQVLDTLIPEAAPGVDDVPDLPDEPESVVGEVYELGPHRLICGDSTDSDVYRALLGDEVVDLLLTDPPYGVSYGGGRAAGDVSTKKNAVVKRVAFGMIANDDLEGGDLILFLQDALGLAAGHCSKDAAKYVWFSWKTFSEFVWVRSERVHRLGQGFYRSGPRGLQAAARVLFLLQGRMGWRQGTERCVDPRQGRQHLIRSPHPEACRPAREGDRQQHEPRRNRP
jgi:hypothetical protein